MYASRVTLRMRFMCSNLSYNTLYLCNDLCNDLVHFVIWALLQLGDEAEETLLLPLAPFLSLPSVFAFRFHRRENFERLRG